MELQFMHEHYTYLSWKTHYEISYSVAVRISLIHFLMKIATLIIYHSGARVARSFVFCVVFCVSLFVRLSFFFWTLLYILLRFTASDYSFGILQLLLLITSVTESQNISIVWLSHHLTISVPHEGYSRN